MDQLDIPPNRPPPPPPKKPIRPKITVQIPEDSVPRGPPTATSVHWGPMRYHGKIPGTPVSHISDPNVNPYFNPFMHMYHNKASDFMFKQFAGFKDFTMNTAKSGLSAGEKTAFWFYNKLKLLSKKWFTHLFLSLCLILYSVMGAVMFMALEVAECQKQWKKLRDCYKKALRLRQYKSGSARKNEKPIKFEKELEFLKPYLQDKPQTSNLGCSEDSLDINTEDNTMIESPAPPSDVMQSPRSDSSLSNYSTRKKSLPLSQLLFTQYLEAKEKKEDPLDVFFLSMSGTVKKMPVSIQAELKKSILGLVTDAEVKLASEERNDTPPFLINDYETQQQRPLKTTQQNYYPPSTSTYIPSTMTIQQNPNTFDTSLVPPPSPYVPQPISTMQHQRQPNLDEIEDYLQKVDKQ